MQNENKNQKFAWLFNNIRDFFLIIGVSVFLIVFIHFAIGGARYIKHSYQGIKTNQALIEEQKKNPIVAGYEGYDDYYKDVNSVKFQALPYYHWRKDTYKGNAVQIDEQLIRRTIKNPDSDAKKVFMFGGSALWGTGSPDKYTIPSQLQDLLGSKFDVYNFGETGFVSIQELNLLLEQLAKGFIPDVVIFYDGPIDIYTGLYSPGRPRHPQFTADDYANKNETSYLLRKLAEKTNYIAILERIKIWQKKDPLSQWEKNVLPNMDQKAQETIQSYAHFMRQTKALGKEYGFKVYHIWQPMLLTETRQLTPFEQDIYNGISPALIQSFQASKDKVQKELSEYDNFYYLGDVFSKMNQPIYIDFCHMGPKGNEIVAKNIYDIISNNEKHTHANKNG